MKEFFLWEVLFLDGSYGYIEADGIIEAANKIPLQNWNQDAAFVAKLELVENGFSENTRDGWYSHADEE